LIFLKHISLNLHQTTESDLQGVQNREENEVLKLEHSNFRVLHNVLHYDMQ